MLIWEHYIIYKKKIYWNKNYILHFPESLKVMFNLVFNILYTSQKTVIENNQVKVTFSFRQHH